MLDWFRNRRRKRMLLQPIPAEWDAWLRLNVWQYGHLDEHQQRKVREFVCILLHEKDWVGGNRLLVTDEMRVTIAGQAALMTLGFERPWYFDRLRTIIVYKGAYSATPQSTTDLIMGGVNLPDEQFDTRLGESWQGGPIVLAWQTVIHEGRNPSSGRCVVIHEFAHHMDSLDGSTNGAPPMIDFKFERQWYRIIGKEYDRLVERARHGEHTLVDKYGATNHAEFFAVICECFFTQPHQLRNEHSDLHSVLVRLFGQDPTQWLPTHQAAH